MTKENETTNPDQQTSTPLDGATDEPLQEKTADFFSRSQRRQEQQHQQQQASQAQVAALPTPHRYTVPAIAVGLNIIWWQQPLIYHQVWQNAGNWQIWSLIAYSIFSAIALGFLVKTRFAKADWRVWASLAASLIVIFNSQLRSRFEVLALLLLFICFLLILPFRAFQLKNPLGLAGLSILLTFSVPICINYLANNYVEPDFLKQSWLLVFATAFYFTPLFLPTAKGRKLGLITGPLFILATLILEGFSPIAFLTIAVALAAYCLTFVRPLTYQIQPLAAILGLIITVMVYYH
ncbi:hypothetical protein [Fructobacillus evanidus]|uniref:Integral membrane protein n=1 Tax=Fructobacillus evanidus TaxID=3064281 RepID=A0ABN9YMV8_9LACO|nr:hypothetical protein R53718_MFFEMHAI_00344 [Fructobacillus sp. LMG 32999]CAK1231073.1 hypothetical protein R55203_MFJFHIJN_00354 [Fructobacillus sp. LMG 32999]CAK1233561.1 hypothetical protein R55214_HHFBAMCI_00474 [Fructobacillus sp. LMG 32999]CAK1236982.1 hypothetical protein R55250_KEHBDPNM_01044 [Fructobacillus sp. LMG 32999]CAK1237572.1 hypothetical protein R54837_OMAIDLJD_00658 [Fructobacillus sp. LMG 32999]